MTTELTAEQKASRGALIVEWNNTVAAAKAAVEKERELRKQVLALNFDMDSSGTKRIELGGGYKLKAVVAMKYKVTKNEAVEPADYSHLPALMAQLPLKVAQEIIRWTPDVSVTAYKALTEDERKIVNQFVIIENGSSSLELETPKEVKNAN